MYINVQQNDGIISTGGYAENKIVHNAADSGKQFDWNKLEQELHALSSSSDASVKQFALEAEEAVEAKNMGNVKACLSKWLPCIGRLIETSYYILEIADKFGCV